MKKIALPKPNEDKEKKQTTEEKSFCDLMLELMRLGLFPRIP